MSDKILVLIEKTKYDRLIRAEQLLDCLEAAGVDNWSGYELAQEMMHNDN